MKSSPLPPWETFKFWPFPQGIRLGWLDQRWIFTIWKKQRLWSPHCYLSPWKFSKHNPSLPIRSSPIHQKDKWQHLLILSVTLRQWWTSSERHWLWSVLFSCPIVTYTPSYYCHCCHLPPHHRHCGCRQCLPEYSQGFLWAWNYWLLTPLYILVLVLLPCHLHITFPRWPLHHLNLSWSTIN